MRPCRLGPEKRDMQLRGRSRYRSAFTRQTMKRPLGCPETSPTTPIKSVVDNQSSSEG